MSTYKAKVLFIEDDPDQIKLYSTKFAIEGYQLISAKDGVEGVGAAIAEKPDIILLDILIFQANGLDVLKILKKNEKTKDIPVIVFSNLDKDDLVRDCLTAGAREYVIKSKVTPKEIVQKVAVALNIVC